MRHKILYLVHGDIGFHHQALYSAATLLHRLLESGRVDIGIHVYTDRPELWPGHPLIATHRLDAGQLKRWRGPLDYVHRIKLEVLRRAESELGLPLVYVDCDTRWLDTPVDALEALHTPGAGGTPLYMHVFEEEVSEHSAPAYFRLLKGKSRQLAEWGIRDHAPWRVWNAGTIGVPVGAEGLFKDVLTVNDGLLPDATVRRTIEQLALSLVVEERFELRAFDAWLKHWWAYGYELPFVLRRFFEGLPPGLDAVQLAAACHAYEPSEAELLAVRQTPEYRRDMAREKRRKSVYKRKIALKALLLRLTRGGSRPG
jgi:hypothetical protein